MKKLILWALLLCGGLVHSQKYTISGYVEDAKSGEKLISAGVFDANSMKGVISNIYGFYSLTLPAGKIRFTVSYIGYQDYVKEIDLNQDQVIIIKLNPSITLSEVEITDSKSVEKVESSQISAIEIPIQSIKKLPVLLGEIDIMKSVQLMPGVQSGNEGTSGLYVRGGGPDQNLILLDGVPVYNADHLFGFFSVFNADAISSVNLIKGGFPARYGGRLSSVLDIRMKEGNNKEFSGEASVGLISSKISLEGPIFKEKTSYIISARRTYIDVLSQPIIRAAAQGEKVNAGYYFYDLNGKINHKFSDKSKLYLSSYMGNDKAYSSYSYEYIENESEYAYKDKADLAWGNITTALRWNYQLNKKLFSNTTLTFSRFRFHIGEKMEEKITDKDGHTDEIDYNFKYLSGIQDWGCRADFDYFPSPSHSIKFGVNEIYHTFRPGVMAAKYSSAADNTNIDTTFGNSNIYANEIQLYIEDDIKIGGNLKANMGLHYSGFFVKEKYYQSAQPRISTRYMFSENFSLKAAYSKMSQYIHLLTNTSIGLPTDLWVPVTDSIKPMNSDQVAVGGVYAINNNMDLSIEGFYKTMDNLIEYKEGASFFDTGSSDWQQKVEIGKGWSYGMEVLLQKHMGKTSGWIGYTLSWSKRKFENISFGEVFPYKYDRRHDISVVVNHQINDNIDVGFTWVFGTGNAITLGLEKYPSFFDVTDIMMYSEPIEYFEHRNNYRMPSYHRMDVGINMHKKLKWAERTWSFGVYNLYNRKNPFYLYFSYDNHNNRVLKQISLFPIIPSARVSFKF